MILGYRAAMKLQQIRHTANEIFKRYQLEDIFGFFMVE